MRAFPLLLLLMPPSSGRPADSCTKEGTVLICSSIPTYFPAGYDSLVMVLSGVEEIHPAMFDSDNLTSIARLTLNNVGVRVLAAESFHSFLSLNTLLLNRNVLSEINPLWLPRPDLLAELSLSDNRVEAVEESTLDGLANLATLRLNGNRIRSVHPNSFRSLSRLAELDLSDNRLTAVSPQVFSNMTSAKVRLHGNPWDCSCGGQDFVNLLKDLQRRSLLDRQMDVTCGAPPSLKGQPVLSVSKCLTSPSPASVTVHRSPSPATAAPGTADTVRPSPFTPETRTSVPPKPAGPTLRPAHTGPDVSINAKPTTAPSPSSSPTAVMKTASCPPRPPANTDPLSTLVAVIGLLCVLLFVLCVLLCLHWRKRSNKTITPAHPAEEDWRRKVEEDRGGSSVDASLKSSADEEPAEAKEEEEEEDGRRCFTGVRAKSAHAVILTASFWTSGRNNVTESEDKGQLAGGEVRKTSEAEEEGEGRNRDTSINGIEERKKEGESSRILHGSPDCVVVNSDVVPYLSMGSNQSKERPEEQLDDRTQGGRGGGGRVMGRISTWPPTAVQWQARCKDKEEEEEEEGGDVKLWTTGAKKELSGDVMTKTTDSDQSETPSAEALRVEESVQVLASVTPTTEQPQDQEEIIPTEERNPLQDVSGSSGWVDPKSEAKTPKTGRAEPKGSKAPSSGASPDDATLLSGNQHAAMDLLHEVVQNNGRWTRERWRQIHGNKQRR